MNLQAINDVYYTYLREFEGDARIDLLFYELFKENLVAYYLTWNKKKNKAFYIHADQTFGTTSNVDLKYFWEKVDEKETFIKKTFISEYGSGCLIIGDKYLIAKYNDSGEASSIRILATEDFDIDKWLTYIKPIETDDSIICSLILVNSRGEFITKSINLTRNLECDVTKNYNDDLPYNKFIEFCNSKESGLALMYGVPGTGKSTFIKHLVKTCDTSFYLMDSSLLTNINHEGFLRFLTDECKDSIIVLEDCEKLLVDRDSNYNPVLGTLLNISDGILSDLLGIKFICTFNTDLSNIDKAVLRKGRLKIKYEFGKLSKEKSKALAKELGHDVDKEMTLADIYNMEPVDFSEKKQTKIGF